MQASKMLNKALFNNAATNWGRVNYATTRIFATGLVILVLGLGIWTTESFVSYAASHFDAVGVQVAAAGLGIIATAIYAIIAHAGWDLTFNRWE